MFELFTSLARRALTLGQDEAIALGHDFMGTEHLLLGLTAVGDGLAGQVLAEHGVTTSRVRPEVVAQLAARGVSGNRGQAAAEALASIGIDVGEIQRKADDTFGPGQFFFPRPAYTDRAKRVLERSLRESKALDHDYVGTEHVLLGVLTEPEGVAFQVIGALGAEPGTLRPVVLDRLAALQAGRKG